MKRTWILTTLLLVWAVASTTGVSYYYLEYTKYLRLSQDLKDKLGEVSIYVNIAIDYGNGTRQWFNETTLPILATVFNATVEVATVKLDPVYGESFITTINGVGQNETDKLYWIWWNWDETQHKWIPGPVANNEYTLSDGQIIIWYLENTAQWPPPSP